MRSSVSPRPSHRLAGVALVAACAIVLAACSSTTKPSGTTASRPLPGITASTVKVGFTVVDLGFLSKALGFKEADYGGVAGETKAIDAIVAYINKNGGMGGRQVTPDIKIYLAATDSPEQSEAQCGGYTQDDRVFAVVLDGGEQTNAIPCYKDANTLVLDETLVAHDSVQFTEDSPYLWSPTYPEYSGFMKAQLAAMNTAKFFDGNTGVLLMPGDDEVSRRTTDQIVKPYLASIGITKVQTSYVDSTNTGTLGATSQLAITAGKNANLNRVIVVGGARIEPVALSDQLANGYNSVWGVSTYDDPVFLQNNPDSIVEKLRVGMTGMGSVPPNDIVGDTNPAFPDPSNPMQQLCVNIVNQAGATPPGNLRTNWKEALEYCDAAMLLKAALDKVPGSAVTGEQFKTAVGQIGSTFRSALTFGAYWGPNIYAGTNAGRSLAWNPNCATSEPLGCYEYSGPTITYGPTSGVGAAASASSTTASVPGPVSPSVASSVPGATSSIGTVPSTPTSAAGGVGSPYPTITVAP